MNARLRPATRDDLLAVQRLLQDAGLITAGVPEHIEDFLVAEEEGRVVGSAGMERYGAEALLRSVAVASGHRSRGLARTLVSQILAEAARRQVQDVYLFTRTAQGYFRTFGFMPVARHEVAEPLRASEEYGACCADAQAMVLHMRPQRRDPFDARRMGGAG